MCVGNGGKEKAGMVVYLHVHKHVAMVQGDIYIRTVLIGLVVHFLMWLEVEVFKQGG